MHRMLMGLGLTLAAATCIDPAIHDRGVITDPQTRERSEVDRERDTPPKEKKVRLDF